MGKSSVVGKVFGFEPYQTAMLIGMAQDVCGELEYKPEETLAACVVCGVTYNGKRDLSILRDEFTPKEDLVNCAPVLDNDFFMEAGRMHMNPGYMTYWLRKYQKEVQPLVRKKVMKRTKRGRTLD